MRHRADSKPGDRHSEDDHLERATTHLVTGLRTLSRQAAHLIAEAARSLQSEQGQRFDPRMVKGAVDMPPDLASPDEVDPALAAAICCMELIRRIGLRGPDACAIAHTGELGAGQDFAQQELPFLISPARWLELLLLAPEESYWESQLFLAEQAVDDYEWRLQVLEARPWSELLRCWSEGFRNAVPPVNNKRAVPTWTAYLERSAGVLAVDCVASRQALKVVGPTTLLARFHEVFDHWTAPRSDGVLFRNSLGQRLAAPSRGKRRMTSHAPETREVYAWICDGLDEAHPHPRSRVFINDPRHQEMFRLYRPALPPCASAWPGDHAKTELERISRDDRLVLPLTATEWDRRPCVDYRSCGGVLIPASKTAIDQILSIPSSPERSTAQLIARHLRTATPGALGEHRA